MIQGLPWWFKSSVDCITLSILCGLLCMYGLKRRPIPRRPSHPLTETSEETAIAGRDLQGDESEKLSICQRILIQPPVGILLFLLGVILAALKLKQDDSAATEVHESEPLLLNALRNISATDWRIGILSGTLTQLPLTTLNSCLSLCFLAHTLFPHHKSQRVSRRSVCISIGLVNFLLCPLGMMPTCHGAGGLAAQHRLGANSGVSMLVLGLFKIALGVIASQGFLLRFLDALPVSILGILLVLAGHELAATGVIKVAKSSLRPSDDVNSMEHSTISGGEDAMVVCLVTALVIVGTGQTHVGALCGWITCAIYGGGEIPFRSCLCSRQRRGRNDNNFSSVEYESIQLPSDI
jgi:MFS superfamily sulfate permease-like transporter